MAEETNSSQMEIIAPGTIGHNSRVEQFTTANTFPGVEAANEIVEFFLVHPSFAFWASHFLYPSRF
jgi:hypothetical protein